MSIYIKGMEMPKSCFECVYKHKFFGEMRCYEFPDFEFDGTEKFPHMEDRSHYCPLTEVPEPHGRLIDADALIAEYDAQHVGEPGNARRLMLDAPTIIPAEQEG